MTIDGLAELRRALRELPETLAREADLVVQAAADAAASEIRASYPEGPTGNLRRGVVRELITSSRFASGAVVRSRAKHASLFEAGTRPRRTADGANRGRMPPASPEQAFIPKAIRARRRMRQQLIDIVRRAGFEVTET